MHLKSSFFLLFLVPVFVFAQGKDPMKWSLRSDIAIPAIIQNTAMKNSMTGVFNWNTGIHFKLYKGITIGAGYQYVRFKAGLRKLNPLTTTTQIDVHGANLRLAYEWTQEKSVFALGLQSSYNYMVFSRLAEDTLVSSAFNQQAISIEPCMHYYFKPNDKVAFGFMLSYSNLSYSFNPYKLGLNDKIVTLNKGDESGNTQTINIGFSVLFGLGKSASGGALGGNNEEW